MIKFVIQLCCEILTLIAWRIIKQMDKEATKVIKEDVAKEVSEQTAAMRKELSDLQVAFGRNLKEIKSRLEKLESEGRK